MTEDARHAGTRRWRRQVTGSARNRGDPLGDQQGRAAPWWFHSTVEVGEAKGFGVAKLRDKFLLPRVLGSKDAEAMPPPGPPVPSFPLTLPQPPLPLPPPFLSHLHSSCLPPPPPSPPSFAHPSRPRRAAPRCASLAVSPLDLVLLIRF